jgi:HSP20 family molecular chaperone IbpA
MLTKYYEPLLSTAFEPIFESFWNTETTRRNDVVDKDGIKIELPGVKAGDVEVNVEGKTLKVTGKSRHGREFSYAYSLRNNVDVEAITARLSDGLLDINIPRKESSTQTRKIEIQY